jgi:hypothetical protein
MTALEDYRVVTEKMTGDLTVKENTQYNEVDVKDVLVHENIKARLFGIVNGVITIKKNAKVFLHGRLLGSVRDEGGRFYHFDE